MNKPMIELADLLGVQHDNKPREVLAGQVCAEALECLSGLAAQVERLRDYVDRGSPWNTNTEKCERIKVLSETPPDTLSTLKAQWQAEAAREIAESMRFDFERIDKQGIESWAEVFLQRAKEHSNESANP